VGGGGGGAGEGEGCGKKGGFGPTRKKIKGEALREHQGEDSKIVKIISRRHRSINLKDGEPCRTIRQIGNK